MTLLPVTISNPYREFCHLPVLAVDLGFSAKKETCGVATCPHDSAFEKSATYGVFLKNVSDWISRQRSEVILIVEAPLSGSFDADGNPVPRGEFERLHSVTGASSPRHWNVMAGASMALAGIHFCKALLTRVTNDITVHLVEGFASRYDKDKPTDLHVAQKLLSLWKDQQDLLIPEPTHHHVSVTDLLCPGQAGAVCAILRMADGFRRTS